MRLHLPVLFIFCCTIGFGQGERYRFSVGGGFHTMMYWGLRDFENMPSGYDYSSIMSIYKSETITVDYKNFASTKQYTFNFSVNWFERRNWSLTQRFYFFKGKFNDGMTQTLTSHSADTTYYPGNTYTNANVITGNETTLTLKSELKGYGTSLFFYKKLFDGKLKIGAGAYWMNYNCYDGWGTSPKQEFTSTGYSPYYYIRARGYYFTNQLGIALSTVWSWKFISFYTTIGNNIVTIKKAENKGYHEWRQPTFNFHFFPTSHNFDFRFPLTFESGISVSFDRIKKCNCPEFD